jgi:hypothetical protein
LERGTLVPAINKKNKLFRGNIKCLKNYSFHFPI